MRYDTSTAKELEYLNQLCPIIKLDKKSKKKCSIKIKKKKNTHFLLQSRM